MSQPQVGESEDSEPLHATLEISFDYTRSLGPTLSEFMTALAGRRILGARASDGRVHAPPFEFDPVTGQPPAELVQVGPAGTVVTWSWMQRPIPGQPLARPFGWAFGHLILGCPPQEVRMGMRVAAVWRTAEDAENSGDTHEASYAIDHFRPTGEPDAPYDSYAHHL